MSLRLEFVQECRTTIRPGMRTSGSCTLGTGGEGWEPAALADLASLAESADWDVVLLEDYLRYRGRPTYDPWGCLAAIAAATTQIRTTATPLPRSRPWDLAAQAMDLHLGWR